MRIASNLTLHAARAYAPTLGKIGSVAPGLNPSSAVQPASASPLKSLVAGRASGVAGQIEFEKPSVPPGGGTLHLYARAADRVEAAVAVQLGRAIDVRG